MKNLKNLVWGAALLALAASAIHADAANGSQSPRVLVTASRPVVTGLEVDPRPGMTVLRLITEGKLRAPASAPLSGRFQVLMPGVDLSAVVGSWGAGSAEVLEVRVSADEAEGIAVVAAPGVTCTPTLFEGRLEIACRTPPEPPGEEEELAVAGPGGHAAGPRVSLDFRSADLRDVPPRTERGERARFRAATRRRRPRLAAAERDSLGTGARAGPPVPETRARARGRRAAGGSGGRAGGRG